MAVTKTTDGIKITVETFYQADYSNPLKREFMFAYQILIENHNHFPVKLRSRHWRIYDSAAIYREVQGDGVLGAQPVITSNEKFEYVSGCNLCSEIGKMYGEYTMENLHTREIFMVDIPCFTMEYHGKKN